MITYLKQLPGNVAGFRATGQVTETDFTSTVMPTVEQLIKTTGKLNYMLVLDTSIRNFSAGAWFKDAVMGLKHLLKWNRAAIVTDVDGIRLFTNMFSIFMPGEFKSFEHKDMQAAIDWVSEKNN